MGMAQKGPSLPCSPRNRQSCLWLQQSWDRQSSSDRTGPIVPPIGPPPPAEEASECCTKGRARASPCLLPRRSWCLPHARLLNTDRAYNGIMGTPKGLWFLTYLKCYLPWKAGSRSLDSGSNDGITQH